VKVYLRFRQFNGLLDLIQECLILCIAPRVGKREIDSVVLLELVGQSYFPTVVHHTDIFNVPWNPTPFRIADTSTDRFVPLAVQFRCHIRPADLERKLGVEKRGDAEMKPASTELLELRPTRISPRPADISIIPGLINTEQISRVKIRVENYVALIEHDCSLSRTRQRKVVHLS
jgi:hypothetical protein